MSSFDEIVGSDVQKKKEEVVIKVGDKEHKFYANELTYPQRLNVAILQQSGGDSIAQMILFSITDKDGRHMSLDQIGKLSEEHAAAFFIAANSINSTEVAKKN